MLTTITQRVLTMLVVSLIAGCGFQLRGAAPVSAAVQPLAVVCNDAVPLTLCQAVEDQLRLGDVNVVERSRADYVLTLSDFRQSRRASAITRNAIAAEYTLRQRVTLSVMTADKVPLVANQEVSSSESYRYDETNILAKQREQDALTDTLIQRLSQQIIFRLTPLTDARIKALRAEANRAAKGQGQEQGPDKKP